MTEPSAAEWAGKGGRRRWLGRALEMAWERVGANRGSEGVDGQSLSEFSEQADEQLNRLQGELMGQSYRPQPVRISLGLWITGNC